MINQLTLFLSLIGAICAIAGTISVMITYLLTPPYAAGWSISLLVGAIVILLAALVLRWIMAVTNKRQARKD